jgi:hypothetical protein
VLRRLKPDFFAEDFDFVRYLGASTGLQEVRLELLNFRDANQGRPSFWRTSLNIRVSGRKAARLARQLLSENRGGTNQSAG